jgi:hypothetical protein
VGKRRQGDDDDGPRPRFEPPAGCRLCGLSGWRHLAVHHWTPTQEQDVRLVAAPCTCPRGGWIGQGQRTGSYLQAEAMYRANRNVLRVVVDPARREDRCSPAELAAAAK